MNRISLASSLAVMLALAGCAPAIFGQTSGSGSSAPRTVAAIGTISNVQLEDGAPAWILSGGWKLRANLTDGDGSSATFVAATKMAKVDGTAMHMHQFSDFALKSWSEANGTITLNGTETITLRNGPTPGVPMSIKLINGGAIAISIDTQAVDHFGSGPMYGLVFRSFDSKQAAPAPGPEPAPAPGATPSNATATNQTGVSRSSVEYYPGATGYLAYPSNGTSLPGVVMIHEWWGLNQNIKNEAEKLAGEGYAVLAVDLYGGRVANDTSSAMAYSGEVRNNTDAALSNLRAAVGYLSGLPNVNSSRIASLGWCFGGGESLQLALNSEKPLAATVLYYGSLVTDQAELAKITWPVLGIFGSADQSIPVDTVKQFESALDANGTPNEIHIYEGVGHAFANPSGDNYAPKETADAWAKTLEFLKANV